MSGTLLGFTEQPRRHAFTRYRDEDSDFDDDLDNDEGDEVEMIPETPTVERGPVRLPLIDRIDSAHDAPPVKRELIASTAYDFHSSLGGVTC